MDARTPIRRPALPSSAEVVVIGGGVIGASILFHLAEVGVTDAVLIDRGELGNGSTIRAAGGVRAQFSDELNVRIGKRSLRAFEDFGRRPGWDIDLEQVGYLFLLTRESDVAAFEASVALQRSLGVETELLDRAQAAELCPLATTDDVLAATFCARDGICTPDAVVQGYASGARRLGAHVETHCEATAIRHRDGRIEAVETAKGAIATDTVICAAGPWSAQVGALAGVALPVQPLRRQILFTEPLGDVPRRLPMTIDFASSLYFHREGPGLLLGMSYAGERPGFREEQSDDWMPDLLAAIERRAPRILDVGIKGGWAGLYENTPDHNALIGEAADRSRFLYATGFSGHGFLQSPGVGEIVRDLLLEREPFVDVAGLSADRFAGERLRPERNIV